MKIAASINLSASKSFWRRFDAKQVVIVAAHPDDETIGCACAIAALKEKAWIIFVTTGSRARTAQPARDAYAYTRRQEAFEALRRLGLPKTRVSWLGFGDQQSSLAISRVVEKLAEWFAKLRPQVILTHPYEGGHPDHDTTAFGVNLASHLTWRASVHAPLVIEFCSYHQGQGAGPRLEPGFLPPVGNLINCELSAEERTLRQRAFESYRSQSAILSCFSLDREQFRKAPAYDFSRPPHPGKLYYEYFDWGVSGAEWRRRARSAMQQLKASSDSFILVRQ